jgi:hypothetical protein
VDVVLVSPAPARARSDRRWRRRGRLLRGRWRRRLSRRRGRRRRSRRRRGLHPGLSRRTSGVMTGGRRRAATGARRWLLLGLCSGRRNPRDQGCTIRSMSGGPLAPRRSRHDPMWNPACGRPEQQERMKRALRQLESKRRRRDPEGLVPIARLERCAPEVAGRGRSSDQRRQSKRLSGNEHAVSMRFGDDGRPTQPAARPCFSPVLSRGRGQCPPIAGTRPPTARERAGPRRSWR